MTAGHAAARYPAGADGAVVADLCCGIGGNLVALGVERRVLAVDRDPVTLAFARHNAVVYGAAGGLAAVAAEVAEIPLAGVARCSSTRPAGRAADVWRRAGSEPRWTGA